MSNSVESGKSWKQIHRESKELKKKYKDQNLEKKLEKRKQREAVDQQKQQKQTTVAPVRSVSTVSIAVPGSILDNAQSQELRTYLAGQIARAACIFKVDEVIVFDDLGVNSSTNPKRSRVEEINDDGEQIRHCCVQLARILQYLECPQYLRKFFFPLHKDLKFSGLLNPLDAPHHLRQQNDFIYREGIVTNKPAKETKGSYVNIGLLNDCLVDKILNAGLRVTVKLDASQDLKSRKLKGVIVSPSEPRNDTGVYWGYTVRIAKSLSDVFLKSPYDNGYDLTIGTSDKGDSIHDVTAESLPYNHALIVYGGLQGLESALETDDKLDAEDPSLLFDHYLNTVPCQGSRTIRTEEAILISLASLQEKLQPQVKPKEFDLGESIPQSEDTGVKQLEHKMPKEKKERQRIAPDVSGDMDRFD
ncbi:putative methyltransferase C9orf114 homolog [Bradysia coprophila]|uniref:putative methyltransferase C9orf114 homolog n=1 Tax=Bradysia coprophila TaxID=38358 RepID=UPI00187DAF97|nr:putative methyltransferase C9orf114 homolog [Bradysia coprophila]